MSERRKLCGPGRGRVRPFRTAPRESLDEQLKKGIDHIGLEFIEFPLFWEGGVNRGDITSRFGVSVPQASNDLGRYKELAGDNIHYDAGEKRYLPTANFHPRFPFIREEMAKAGVVARHMRDARFGIPTPALIKLPSGVFRPFAGVSTAILLFTKAGGILRYCWRRRPVAACAHDKEAPGLRAGPRPQALGDRG